MFHYRCVGIADKIIVELSGMVKKMQETTTNSTVYIIVAYSVH